MEMQTIGNRSLDESFLGKRIEYLAEFDMDEAGTKREIRWCSGVIQKICDGTWQIQGEMRGQCYKESKAAKVFWDAIPDAEMEAFSYSSIESFVAKKWNGNCVGAWKLDYTSKQYNDV